MKTTPSAKIKAEFEKLSAAEQRTLLAELQQVASLAGNPITTLAEYVQKEFGGNMTTEIWIEGESHQPVVYCKFTLPNGSEYTASGKNQKVAKLLAAEQAMKDLRQTRTFAQ
jgi:dsRNA-specific ribonuclease